MSFDLGIDATRAPVTSGAKEAVAAVVRALAAKLVRLFQSHSSPNLQGPGAIDRTERNL